MSEGRDSNICKRLGVRFGFWGRKEEINSKYDDKQMLQVDLLLRPANLTGPVPTWHGAPSQVNH